MQCIDGSASSLLKVKRTFCPLHGFSSSKTLSVCFCLPQSTQAMHRLMVLSLASLSSNTCVTSPFQSEVVWIGRTIISTLKFFCSQLASSLAYHSWLPFPQSEKHQGDIECCFKLKDHSATFLVHLLHFTLIFNLPKCLVIKVLLICILTTGLWPKH